MEWLVDQYKYADTESMLSSFATAKIGIVSCSIPEKLLLMI